MATEIKVITVVETAPNVAALNPDEREAYFDKIVESVPGTPRTIVDDWEALMLQQGRDALTFERPKLQELLLRRVINIANLRRDAFIMPVIAPIDGSASEAKMSVKVRFETRVHVVTENDLVVVMPPGVEINVVGISVSPICAALTPNPDSVTWQLIAIGHLGGVMRDCDAPFELIHYPLRVAGREANGTKFIFTPSGDSNGAATKTSPTTTGAKVAPTSGATSRGQKTLAVTKTMPSSRKLADIPLSTQRTEFINIDLLLDVLYKYLYGDHVALSSVVPPYVYAQLELALRGKSTTKAMAQFIRQWAPKSQPVVPTADIAALRAEAEHSDNIEAIQALISGDGKGGRPGALVGGIVFPTGAALVSDLTDYGLHGPFILMNIVGRDDPRVEEIFSQYRARQSRAEFYRAIAVKNVEERNRLSVMRVIIERKFGTTKLAKYEHAASIARKPLLSVLTDADRKIVEAEYSMRERYIEAVLANKCPHVRLYKQLRAAASDEARRRILVDLQPYLGKGQLDVTRRPQARKGRDSSKERDGAKARQRAGGARATKEAPAPSVDAAKDATEANTAKDATGVTKTTAAKTQQIVPRAPPSPNETGQIKCQNCGFDIMCPHVLELMQLELSQAEFSQVKARMSPFLSPSRDYCRICGESLSSVVVGEVAKRDPVGSVDEELRIFTWGEVASLMRYLRLSPMVDTRALITQIRDAIYDHVYEVEKHILKSKTNTVEEIKAKKRLFTAIYALAYVVHMIASSASKKAAQIAFKGVTETRPKNLIVTLIKTAIDIIMMSRNVIIKTIPGMSPDIIKNKIIESYKVFSARGMGIIEATDESRDTLMMMLMDPVYQYVWNINTIDAVIHGMRRKPIKDLPYLGPDPESMIFSEAVKPKFDKKWALEAFDTPPKSPWMARPGAWSGYSARSYELFHKRLTSDLHTKFAFVDILGGRREPDAPMDVKLRDEHQKYQDEYLAFHQLEAPLLRAWRLQSLKNFTPTIAENTRQWKSLPAHLGRIYDEDGEPHKWDKLILEDGREVTQADINKDINGGQAFITQVVNTKCSVCSVLRTDVDKLDAGRILESLRIKNTISNFFRFYENRCPDPKSKGIHTMEPIGAPRGAGKAGPRTASGAVKAGAGPMECIHCGVTTLMYANNNSRDSVAYYKRWRETYERERDEFAIKWTAPAAPVQSKPVTQDDSALTAEYANYAYNFNVVLDLASRLKINHRLLSSLGAIERQNYDDVVNGTYIPPEPTRRYDTRVFVLRSHAKNLITEYNMLMNFARLVKPPPDLLAVMNASGISKQNWGKLGDQLPPVYNDYDARFAYIQRTKKPREIVEWCIQALCEMCIRIYSDGSKETEKLRHEFVSHYIRKITRGDELLTKPGQFNWALIYGEKEQRDKTDINADREEPEAADEKAPLNQTGFDIDVDPDAEEGDDDVDMGSVGENYGLD